MEFVEKRLRLEDLYVTAGDRLYAIGSQDGGFPRLGGHIQNEMGGLWVHPQKVLDGFWLGLQWDQDEITMPRATSVRTWPAFTEHCYRSSDDWSMWRRQWVPDGLPALVVDLTVKNETSTPKMLNVSLWLRSNLRPGWLSAEQRGHDWAEVSTNPPGIRFQNDSHPWQLLAATSAVDAKWETTPVDMGPDPRSRDDGVAFGRMQMKRQVGAGEAWEVSFWLAASSDDQAADAVHDFLVCGREDLLMAKTARLHQIKAASALSVPDAAILHAYTWAKWQTDWLVREVPGMGRGLGAGFPEYPWWFGCDNGYALRGVLATGQFELAQDTLRLLAEVSKATNGDGRIIHEVSTTGAVYNPGNSQESAQFCQLVYEVFRWTGDLAFVEEMFPAVQAALGWLLQQAPDGDDLAYGYGIIEIQELNLKLVDTAVYTVQALEALAALSTILGREHEAEEYRQRGKTLKETINRVFWQDAEGLYADIVGDPDAMAQRLSLWAKGALAEGRPDVEHALLEKIRSDSKESTFNLRNWVINTPIEAGIASEEQARIALRRMRAGDFCGPYGLYLSGLWQDKMMTISTGVQAVAEARYGYADWALDLMRKMALTMDWRMPGSMSEMSPDEGCFVQAWTLYGLAVPIVEYFFGLSADAYRHHLTLTCSMPRSWPWAELRHVRMGTNYMDFSVVRRGDVIEMTVCTAEAWTVEFGRLVQVLPPLSQGTLDLRSKIELPSQGSVTVRWQEAAATSEKD